MTKILLKDYKRAALMSHRFVLGEKRFKFLADYMKAELCFRLTPHPRRPRILYVSDKREWSTRDDGRNIVYHLSGDDLFDINQIHRISGVAKSVIHFGSLPITSAGLRNPWSRHNTIISTVFHGNYGIGEINLENHLNILLERRNDVRIFVTSCSFMRDRLIRWGVPSDRVRMIPLGVKFMDRQRISTDQRINIRRSYGIADEEFCVGSWQKDGQGWKEGNKPKDIKGPDILIDTLSRLKALGVPVVALLSGPARGFVKNGLTQAGVRYIHEKFDEQAALHRYMSIADACVVTSREEGGPKAILEAMAHGVPVVSTRVGMAPDVIANGVNGILCEQEDIEALAHALYGLRTDPGLARRISAAGSKTAQEHDWSRIAMRYKNEVYWPVIREVSAMSEASAK